MVLAFENRNPDVRFAAVQELSGVIEKCQLSTIFEAFRHELSLVVDGGEANVASSLIKKDLAILISSMSGVYYDSTKVDDYKYNEKFLDNVKRSMEKAPDSE